MFGGPRGFDPKTTSYSKWQRPDFKRGDSGMKLTDRIFLRFTNSKEYETKVL